MNASVKPARSRVQPAGLPTAMIAASRWVLWRHEWRDGKWTKVPYCVSRPTTKASSTNRRTWGPFTEALEMFERLADIDGIGFVLGDGWVGIDHDAAPLEAPLAADVLQLVREVNSYTEASQSRRGLHILVQRGTLPGTARRRGPVEMYDSGRFFCMTGETIPGCPTTLRTDDASADLARVHARFIAPPAEPTDGRGPGARPAGSPADDAILTLCRQARNRAKFVALFDNGTGDKTPSEHRMQLLCLLAFYTRDAAQLDRLFRASALYTDEKKWARLGAKEIDRALSLVTETYAPPGPVPPGATKETKKPPKREIPWPAPLRPEAFHGVLGEIAQAIAPQTEADPAAILVQLFVMFGNILGRSAHFTAGADTHYLNLFVGLVGPTAKGRKGMSHGQARRLFEAVDREWFDRSSTSGSSTGEGLIWQIRDEIRGTTPIKEKGRVVGYEEVIEDKGVADKRLLVVETEFAGPIKCMSRLGNTLSPVIRQAWDGIRLKTSTKNSPGTATDPHVSIIGHITRDELRRYLDVTESANGLGNRFLWMCVKRSKLLPDGGDAVDLTRFVPLVRHALVFGQSLGAMPRDGEAKRLWHTKYAGLSADRPGMFGAMTARAEALVCRLACVYAITDLSATVGVRHLRSALAVWDYAQASAQYIFGDQLGDPVADEILRFLRDRHNDARANSPDADPDPVSRTEITEALQRNRTAQEIDRALAVLADAFLIQRVPPPEAQGPGRPPELWRLTRNERNEENEETPPHAPAPSSSFVSFVSFVAPEDSEEADHEVA